VGIGAKSHGRCQAALTAVKLIHTLVWFSIECCMVYVLWAGFSRRSDRRAAIAAGIVAGETVIFVANGFRCPLARVAERLGAESGSVTDVYLPRWLAHNLPAIHVPLIALAGRLHARNLREISPIRDERPPASRHRQQPRRARERQFEAARVSGPTGVASR